MKTMTISELHTTFQNLQKDELILDVRTTGEFAEGHVPGSKNIPVDIVMKHHEELRSFKTVYIYCRAGRRAEMALQMLSIQGLTNLVCVDEGGFPDWEDAGFQIQK
jgi:rhodanese-related sulfurtransferase